MECKRHWEMSVLSGKKSRGQVSGEEGGLQGLGKKEELVDGGVNEGLSPRGCPLCVWGEQKADCDRSGPSVGCRGPAGEAKPGFNLRSAHPLVTVTLMLGKIEDRRRRGRQRMR